MVSDWSKDNSTQVGAVVVNKDREIVATGFNGMPRGVNDDLPERHARPAKYIVMEHAERNAIYSAARRGISLKDCTIYVTSKPGKFPPCSDCARGIIQAGISRVVGEPIVGEAWERWKESCEAGFQMFAEAGVKLDQVSL